MATKVSIPALIQALGGKENLAQATHCATRLRVTTRDKSKIDEAALKAIPGVLGVVNNGTQTQIIIGAEVNNVYKDFIAQAGVDEEAPIDENLDLKDELKNKKGKLLTRFFETVAAIFNPIVPALAGCGFLSALICIWRWVLTPLLPRSKPSLPFPWPSSPSCPSCWQPVQPRYLR